jgi:hypothetical protein
VNGCEEADECVFDRECPFYAPGCEQFEDDNDPMDLTEKMATAMIGLAIITELVRPGRASALASVIEAVGRVLPCGIGKPVDPGRESTEVR